MTLSLLLKELGVSLRSSERVIHLNFMSLQEFSTPLADHLKEDPEETIGESGIGKDPRVRLTEIPKESFFVKIREIRARHLDQFLWIEGIVRQASEVRPQVVNAKFECPSCGAILS